METVYVKHEWTRIDKQNRGHTPNEWGKIKPQNIIAYKVSWEEE